MQSKVKKSFTLLALILVFAIPMLAAFVLYQHQGWLQGKSGKQHGELLQPPSPIASIVLDKTHSALQSWNDLKGHWQMVYFAPNECRARCQRQLHLMRQMHVALNRDQNRMQRILLTQYTAYAPTLKEWAHEHYPELQIVFVDAKQVHALQTRIADAQTDKLAAGGILLVDPLGNIMMRYPQEVSARYILKDVKHLLKASYIG